MRHQLLLAPLFLLGLFSGGPACTAESEQEPYDDLADQTDPLVAELTEKYGVRPRRYLGFFNDDEISEAERRFRAELPRTYTELESISSGHGRELLVDEAELALNFITEGGFILLNEDISDSDFDPDVPRDDEILINGWNHLGTDTFYDNLDALRPWFTEDLETAWLLGEIYIVEVVNELGQTVTTIVVPNIEIGIQANALVYYWTRGIVDRHLSEAGVDAAAMEPEGRFWWTTVYFNAGPGRGKAILDRDGADSWRNPWTGPDDHATQSRYARYNAGWRTASYEFTKARVYEN